MHALRRLDLRQVEACRARLGKQVERGGLHRLRFGVVDQLLHVGRCEPLEEAGGEDAKGGQGAGDGSLGCEGGLRVEPKDDGPRRQRAGGAEEAQLLQGHGGQGSGRRRWH